MFFLMQLFKPSKAILEKICDGEELVATYRIFPPNPFPRTLETMMCTSVMGVLYEIAEYYRGD